MAIRSEVDSRPMTHEFPYSFLEGLDQLTDALDLPVYYDNRLFRVVKPKGKATCTIVENRNYAKRRKAKAYMMCEYAIAHPSAKSLAAVREALCNCDHEELAADLMRVSELVGIKKQVARELLQENEDVVAFQRMKEVEKKLNNLKARNTALTRTLAESWANIYMLDIATIVNLAVTNKCKVAADLRSEGIQTIDEQEEEPIEQPCITVERFVEVARDNDYVPDEQALTVLSQLFSIDPEELEERIVTPDINLGNAEVPGMDEGRYRVVKGKDSYDVVDTKSKDNKPVASEPITSTANGSAASRRANERARELEKVAEARVVELLNKHEYVDARVVEEVREQTGMSLDFIVESACMLDCSCSRQISEAFNALMGLRAEKVSGKLLVEGVRPANLSAVLAHTYRKLWEAHFRKGHKQHSRASEHPRTKRAKKALVVEDGTKSYEVWRTWEDYGEYQSGLMGEFSSEEEAQEWIDANEPYASSGDSFEIRES